MDSVVDCRLLLRFFERDQPHRPDSHYLTDPIDPLFVALCLQKPKFDAKRQRLGLVGERATGHFGSQFIEQNSICSIERIRSNRMLDSFTILEARQTPTSRLTDPFSNIPQKFTCTHPLIDVISFAPLARSVPVSPPARCLPSLLENFGLQMLTRKLTSALLVAAADPAA